MAQSLWQGQRCKLLKFNFGCFAVLLTAGLSSVSSTTAADKSEAVKVAILRHSEAISQIDSYHIKLETHSSHLEGLPDSDSLRFGPYVIGGDRRLVHESTTEIWQSDTQRRWIDRTFFSVGEKGVLDFGQNGRVYEYSLDNSAIRFLSGWDWEHPPALVLPLHEPHRGGRGGRLRVLEVALDVARVKVVERGRHEHADVLA